MWLMRAVWFLREFMSQFMQSYDPNVNECVYISYQVTLRAHHNWVVRSLFSLAMRSLPSKDEFLKGLAINPTDYLDNKERFQSKVSLRNKTSPTPILMNWNILWNLNSYCTCFSRLWKKWKSRRRVSIEWSTLLRISMSRTVSRSKYLFFLDRVISPDFILFTLFCNTTKWKIKHKTSTTTNSLCCSPLSDYFSSNSFFFVFYKNSLMKHSD